MMVTEKKKMSGQKNIMVSLRIPKSLVQEFRHISEKDHFLDLSEAIRSTVRQKYMKYSQPEAYELKKLREEISDSVKKNVIKQDQKIFVKKLDKIKKILEEGV